MASTRTGLLCHLQSVLSAGMGSRLLDGQLLEQFTTEQDQAAFATLVRRHGPMVLNVCRRVLHNAADAEDAFQATFLVLARKASAIGKREALAAWLHQVAYRVALRTRAAAAQRHKHEEKATGRLGERGELGDDPLATITGRELLTALDEELQTLPARSRAPLILCYLEEQTREEAARHLGLTLATLKRRLERGRALLRRRLERRGLALAAAFLMLDSLQVTARAALPGLLAATTTRAAMQAAAGKGLAEATSAQIAVLVTGTLRAMALGKAMVASTFLIAATLVGMGIGFTAYLGQAAPRDDQRQPRTSAAPPSQGPQQAEEKKTAAPAEHLPAGARARFGSARFLNIGRVFAVAYSPDGRLVAGGAWDGSIRIWNTATGKERVLLDAHMGPVHKLAFSPDGKLLASAGRDPGLCLWEVTSGRLVRIIQLDTKRFSEVSFSPDGRKLAGIARGIIYVWNEAGEVLWSDGGWEVTGKRIYTHCAFRGPDSVAFAFYVWNNSPFDYTELFLGSRSFETAKESESQEVLPRSEYHTSVSLGPNGNCIAFRTDFRSREGVVSYIHPHDGKPTQPIRIKDLRISSVCVSPDGRMIALTGDSWALEGGRDAKFIQILESCTGQLRCRFECRDDKGEMSLVFAPDCRTLCSGSVDVTALLWDLTGQTQNPGSAGPLRVEELDRLWNALKSRDGEHAFRALWKLVRAPEQATAYLAKVLRPVSVPDPKRIANLMHDLSDKRFAVRQQATAEIARLEDLGESALKEALNANPVLELRLRIEHLLARLDQLSPEKVREVRAVEALERIHTPQADEVLRKLAHGPLTARLTREAAEACRRLEIKR